MNCRGFFVQGLLKVVLLPEYTARCTYTTTEIRAGNEDIAEIYFYSKEKFEENFQRMLKDIGWEDAESFADMELRKFERYWATVRNQNPALYQQHNGTTVEEIRMILGKQSQDDIARGTSNTGSKLREWGMSNGIEELKAKMQRYYDTERLEVLARRAENGITNAKNFLNAILSKYDGNRAEGFDDGGQYLLQAKDALKEFSTRAGLIGREYQQQISAKLPFSSLISDGVEEMFTNIFANKISLDEFAHRASERH